MFKNREEAGRLLAHKLKAYILTLPWKPKVSSFAVAAIPRGGIVVGKEIASDLGIPLIPLIVKKISHPSHPELALGAVGPFESIVWNVETLKNANLSDNEKEQLLKAKEIEQLERELFLGIQKVPNFSGKNVLLVDDGVATGSSVLVARKALFRMNVAKVLLVTPVISEETANQLWKDFDGIVALSEPTTFNSVGEFYQHFPQTEDDQVRKIIFGFLQKKENN